MLEIGEVWGDFVARTNAGMTRNQYLKKLEADLQAEERRRSSFRTSNPFNY